MTDPIDPEVASPDKAETRPGERLAKAIARAGLGSRREAEGWIGEGRVVVNGERVTTAAFNVMPSDRVEVDGRPLPARERTRLWLYHKPRGYVTTTHDPEGRETVFSVLPAALPRVVSIGRLDINTEGLLLLTNDGGLARVLELPETGWLRRYRVRAFGKVTQEALDALKDGVTIDGFAYGAIEAAVERQQSDNVWLTLGLREGKNREVKRVAEHLGLAVNRLIRVSFGPFQLGGLAEGEAEEVRTRTLAEQLGPRLAEEAGCDFETPAGPETEGAPRMTGGRGAGRVDSAPRERSRVSDPSQRLGRRAPIARPRDMAAPVSAAPQDADASRTRRGEPIADRRGRKIKVERVARPASEEAPKRVHRREDGAAERFGAASRGRKPAAPRDARPAREGDERPKRPRSAAGASFGGADRPRRDGDRPRPEGGSGFDRPRTPRPAGERPYDKPRGPRRDGDAAKFDRPRAPRRDGDAAATDRPRAPRPEGGRPPRFEGSRPPRSDGPRGPRPEGGRPPRFEGSRPPRSDGPRTPRPEGGRPPRRDYRPVRAEGAPAERGPARVSQPRWPDAGPTSPRPERGGDRPYRSGPRSDGDRAPRSDRPAGEGGGGRPQGRPGGGAGRDRPGGGGKPSFGGRPGPGGKPGAGGKPGGRSFGGGKPGGPAKPFGGRPGGRPGGSGKPAGGGRPTGGGGKGRPGGADRRR
ncbi:pseudouridine synthase [Hansschlegelia sp. KR7-227]|uniref:pseudouridine synthase n=1 Tax=Hansschlegelia sp. KR7-227 TaxID=3400914 RepID=UPI003C127043